MLKINVKPSKMTYLMVLIPHFLALMILLLLPEVSIYFRLVISILVLISMIYYFRWHIKQSLDKSIKSLRLDEANRWYIDWQNIEQTTLTGINLDESGETQRKEAKQVQLLPGSFFSQWLVILNFKDKNDRKYTVLLPIDCLEYQDFRRLRVHLRTRFGKIRLI